MLFRIFSIVCSLVACGLLFFVDPEDTVSQFLVTLLLALVAVQLYFEQGSSLSIDDIKVDFDSLKTREGTGADG